MKEKICQFIKNCRMVRPGETVCVGVSGGADSVCLAQMLLELRDKLGIRVTAFHVNHCLRGEESDGDEAFVRRFCREREISLKCFRFDVARMAKERKQSLEEAGRTARRQAAAACLAEGFADKIALAHHSGDQAETVLFHLARGSSVTGLRGILPVNGNVIRPLLEVGREEIEKALDKRGISWRTDATNLEETYARNRIRRVVLPYLEENINAKSSVHIAAAARDLAEADEILQALAQKEEMRLTEETDSGFVIRPEITVLPVLLAGYVIRSLLQKMTGTVRDITRTTVQEVLRLFSLQVGRKIHLPYGVTAARVYEGIRLFLAKESGVFDKNAEAKLEIGRDIWFNEMTFYPEYEKSPVFPDKIPKKRYTKWFDCDRIAGCCFRTRRAGDYLVTDSLGHRKKLKEFFIEEKIPKELRDRIVLLADGPRVAWVVGYRIGEDCRVTEKTKSVIKISVAGGEADESGNQDIDR